MSINDDTVELRLPDPLSDDPSVPTAPLIRVTVGIAAHPGTVRTDNEDNFLVGRRSPSQKLPQSDVPPGTAPTQANEDLLMLVADGIGGETLAAVARRLLMPTVWEITGQVADSDSESRNLDAVELHKRVNNYSERIEQHLEGLGQCNPGLISAGTTLTAAQLIGCDAVVVRIGDPQAYICRGKSCRQIAIDDPFGQALPDAGPVAVERDRLNGILRDCFSIDNVAMTIPVLHHERLADRDRLLLTTGDLTGLLSDNEIAETIHAHRNVQTACEALMDRAVKRGVNPGLTLALAEVRDFRSPSPISPAPRG